MDTAYGKSFWANLKRRCVVAYWLKTLRVLFDDHTVDVANLPEVRNIIMSEGVDFGGDEKLKNSQRDFT